MAKQERKLPEVLEHEFIITDESVNRYGWRVIVSGIDLSGFMMNPVCCVQHNTWDIPVGKWKNVRADKGKLLGTVEFDRNDEDAVKLYWKYKDGFMNAVSLNIYPVEESDDPSQLLPGQKMGTVTKSEMLEISLVTIPGQKNAVKLTYPDGKEYKLDLSINNSTKKMEKETKTVEQLQAELQVQKKLNADNLIKLHLQRGVVSEGEVEPLKELALSNYESVSKMLEARKAPDSASGDAKKGNPAETLAEALVKLHFDRGAISDPEKNVYKLSAIADYEGTRKALEAKTGVKEVKNFVQGIGVAQAAQESDERSKWTYLDFYKKDMRALALMEKEEPEKYKKLVADFESECGSMGIGSLEK